MNLFKKVTATAALAALASGLMITGVSAASSSQIEAANKLAEKGIVVDQSKNPTAYELNRNVLRQEIAAVSRGIAGVAKATEYKAMFSDVTKTTPNTWAWQTVEALRANSLIAANNMFNPEQNITKAESIGMVVKACFKNEYSYDSSKTSSWQEQVVTFADTKGLVSKFSDYNALATRGFVFEAAANCYTDDSAVDIDNILCQLTDSCTKDEPADEPKEEPTDTVVSGSDTLMVKLSAENPATGNIPVGVSRSRLLTFEVTAGSEDVTLKSGELKFTGLGDAKYIEDVALYAGDVKVTRGSRKFQSDNTLDLSFERDVIVKAGETVKMYVGAYLKDGPEGAAQFYQPYQVELTELEGSASVEGLTVTGPTLYPIVATNVAAGKLEAKKQVGKLTIGEDAYLADFSIEEVNDKEDLVVKSITFEVDGIDSEDIDNLMLTAEGKEVTADFTYQRGKIVASMDYTITKDTSVDFLLKGTAVSGIDDTLKLSLKKDAVYAMGADTNVTASVTVKDTELASRTIEGSEINIAFERTDKDELQPETDDFKVGTVTMTAASNYTIDKLTITVKNNNTSVKIKDILKDIELDGIVPDDVDNEDTTTATYTFEDFYLTAGETKELPLTISIKKEGGNTLDGISLKITPAVTKVEDEDNNETYEGSNLSKVLSSTALTAKILDIETAGFELIAVNVRDTDVVLYNGVKTVLHEMKAYVSDSSDVTINSLTFKKNTTPNPVGDLGDIIDKATLNIGGKSFEGDVLDNEVRFNSINATIAAGADNVEFLFYATLKDNDSMDGKVLAMKFHSIDVEDENNNELSTNNLETNDANDHTTKTTIAKSGYINAQVTNSEDDIDTTVLAGTSSVNLAEVKMKAELEDADVEELVFTVKPTTGTVDYSDTFKNVKLMDGATTLVSGARVKNVNGVTTITFEDFTLPKSSSYTDYMLVADVNAYTTDGSEAIVALGTVTVKAKSIKAKGKTSQEDYTAATITGEGTQITISPIEATYSVVDKFDDDTAKIKFTVTTGENDLNSDDIMVKSVKFEGTQSTDITKMDVFVTGTTDPVATMAQLSGNKITFATPVEISNGDELRFVMGATADKKVSLTIVEDGIEFTSSDTGATTYYTTNDAESLGSYEG